MSTKTDTDRVIAWFRDHPDSTVMECRFDLYISAVTQRMSDARKEGYEFTKYRDKRGHWRFRLHEPGQRELGVGRMTRHDAERADRILGFIADYLTAYGHAPSVREIARGVGLASTSAVHHWLRKLRADGRLDWTPGQARTLDLRRPSVEDLTADRIELAYCLSTHGMKPPKVRPCKRHRVMALWIAETLIPRALDLSA